MGFPLVSAPALLRLLRDVRGVGAVTDRLELPETGQVFHAGHAVVAANIWPRAPLDDPGAPVALRAQIIVGERARRRRGRGRRRSRSGTRALARGGDRRGPGQRGRGQVTIARRGGLMVD